MCLDGEGMYVSEMHTRSLCILDLETGILSPIEIGFMPVCRLRHYIQDKNTAQDSGFTQMPIDHDGKNYHYVDREKMSVLTSLILQV